MIRMKLIYFVILSNQVGEALKYDIDAVYFADDRGMQKGLIMGYDCWKEFIYPEL